MNFGEVLEDLKAGYSMTRAGWNGKGLFISLQEPDANSKMTRPYVYLTSPIGSTNQYGEEQKEHRIPWIPSQTDLFADDWEYYYAPSCQESH